MRSVSLDKPVSRSTEPMLSGLASNVIARNQMKKEVHEKKVMLNACTVVIVCEALCHGQCIDKPALA
jgi:hypothetical protein